MGETATALTAGAAAGASASAAAPRAFNWKTFWVLTAAGVAGTLAVIPAALSAQADVLKDLPIPLWVILPLQTIQNAVFVGVAVGLGLWLGGKVGLGTPLVEEWVAGGRVGGRLRGLLLPSVAPGLAVAASLIALDEAVFSPRMPAAAAAAPAARAPLWQDLLATLYGGITEELLMRLGLLTICAWLFVKLGRSGGGVLGPKAFWAANFVVAVLFGLAHLPATAYFMPLTPLVVTRAVILNGVAGLTFGYLYWKRGLESAILAHLTADVVLVTGARLLAP